MRRSVHRAQTRRVHALPALLAGLLVAPLLTTGPARADVVPGTCTAAPPLSSCPSTTITAHPDASTAQTSAAFAYTWSSDGAAIPDSTATFQCKLAGPGHTEDFGACPADPVAAGASGTRQYDGLAPGSYTFTVHASGQFGPGPDATYSWTVTDPPPPTGTAAPQTTFRTKPGVYLKDDFFELRFTADQPVSDYACTLDGVDKGCHSGSYLLRGVSRGTHRFTVAATGTDGRVDTTPASTVFTLPVDSTALHYSKGWSKRIGRGCFLDTYSITRRKGASVQQYVRDASRVDLVVTRAPGYGSVRVYLGKHLLRTISLAAGSTRREQFVPVASWGTRRTGTVTVVTTSKKPVVVEGLGFVGKPKG